MRKLQGTPVTGPGGRSMRKLQGTPVIVLEGRA